MRLYEKIEEVKMKIADLRMENHNLLKNVKGGYLDVSIHYLTFLRKRSILNMKS